MRKLSMTLRPISSRTMFSWRTLFSCLTASTFASARFASSSSFAFFSHPLRLQRTMTAATIEGSGIGLMRVSIRIRRFWSTRRIQLSVGRLPIRPRLQIFVGRDSNRSKGDWPQDRLGRESKAGRTWPDTRGVGASVRPPPQLHRVFGTRGTVPKRGDAGKNRPRSQAESLRIAGESGLLRERTESFFSPNRGGENPTICKVSAKSIDQANKKGVPQLA
ncbi:hypothetical protein BH23VER1_BH23VER1_13500 [soil metagenome]